MTAPQEQTPDPNIPDPNAEPSNAPEAPEGNENELPDWVRAKLQKVNREAQNLRTRVHELEPLAQEAEARRQAEMTEIQRYTEANQTLTSDLAAQRELNERLVLANRYTIPESHHRYIVGSSPEEREDAAKGIAEMLSAVATPPVTPPPSNRPTANLRPGASPATQDDSPPTAYPPEWIPNRNRPKQG
ncbi:hypothetical protein [Nocardia vaccinii]|uniref:hypothetical protein n=1 Tax=Nocardia vaccinii TaxID=1822 RepID=UPI00082EC870|nr:hypothetical protein [Nocardia vaccinii]